MRVLYCIYWNTYYHVQTLWAILMHNIKLQLNQEKINECETHWDKILGQSGHAYTFFSPDFEPLRSF